MAENLDYTDIIPAAGDEDLLRFALNRLPSADESSFIASRKLTVSGDAIEVRVQGQFESDPRDAVRTAIARVDIALRMLAEESATAGRGEARSRAEVVVDEVGARMARKKRQADEREEPRTPDRRGGA